jgi:hypothetical protein
MIEAILEALNTLRELILPLFLERLPDILTYGPRK